MRTEQPTWITDVYVAGGNPLLDRFLRWFLDFPFEASILSDFRFLLRHVFRIFGVRHASAILWDSLIILKTDWNTRKLHWHWKILNPTTTLHNQALDLMQTIQLNRAVSAASIHHQIWTLLVDYWHMNIDGQGCATWKVWIQDNAWSWFWCKLNLLTFHNVTWRSTTAKNLAWNPSHHHESQNQVNFASTI